MILDQVFILFLNFIIKFYLLDNIIKLYYHSNLIFLY